MRLVPGTGGQFFPGHRCGPQRAGKCGLDCKQREELQMSAGLQFCGVRVQFGHAGEMPLLFGDEHSWYSVLDPLAF